MVINKLDDKDPDVIAKCDADARLNQLKGRLQEAEEQRVTMDTEFSRHASMPQHSRIDAQATAMLEGRELPVVTRDDLERQRGKVEVLNETVNKQSAVVLTAKRRVSKHLEELNASEYFRIEKRILDAIDELSAANEEEAKFLSEIRDAGYIGARFRSMRVQSIGCAGDSQGRAAMQRKELKEFCPEVLD